MTRIRASNKQKLMVNQMMMIIIIIDYKSLVKLLDFKPQPNGYDDFQIENRKEKEKKRERGRWKTISCEKRH